jgi:hypothetical protein
MMGDFKNFYILRKPRTAARQSFSEIQASQQREKLGHGIHYLATQRGFLKGFVKEFDGNRGMEISKATFTSNARFAQQFDSFQAADHQGRMLMHSGEGVRYYAIVKPA